MESRFNTSQRTKLLEAALSAAAAGRSDLGKKLLRIVGIPATGVGANITRRLENLSKCRRTDTEISINAGLASSLLLVVQCEIAIRKDKGKKVDVPDSTIKEIGRIEAELGVTVLDGAFGALG
jgi:hypothetical protein